MSEMWRHPIGRRTVLAWAPGAMALMAWPRRTHARGPRRGGVLKHIGLEPPTFDIQAVAPCETAILSSFVRRTLFKFASGGDHGPSEFKLVPDLAVAATASLDGRTYTIALRRGVRWEQKPPVNGRELSAADVKYSMERALARSPYASLLGPVQGIEAAGTHTLRVHLREPFVPFLPNLAEPWNAVLAPEIEERWGDLKSSPSLVGCGPFVLERYEPGVKAILTRNPDYYRRGLPYLDRIEWIFLRDRTTQMSLFHAGEVDIPSFDGCITRAEAALLARSKPSYPIRYWDGLVTRALAMRTDKPPLGDARVRRALSMAVNRRRWVRDDLGGQGFEDSGPVPAPMHQWKLPLGRLGEGARYLGHDVPLARALLAESGFANGLKLKCSVGPSHDPESGEELERLVADLRQVGVELSLNGEDYGGYARGSFLGRFDEAAWSTSPPFGEVDSYLYAFYRSGLPINRSHVADSVLDTMLESQRSIVAPAARKKIIDDIQRHAAAQVYYLYTPSAKRVAAWTPWVKNYGPKNSLDRGAQLELVWLDQ